MIALDYQILRLFVWQKRWVLSSFVRELKLPSGRVATRLASLIKRELVCRYRGGYEITEDGRRILRDAVRNKVLRNPHPWIARVRAGLDTDGHELNLPGRAAIPSPEPAEMSYEMDIDAFIDAKRAGLLNEWLDD